MNLRTLKKLSKRSAAILSAHYGKDIPEIFLAERGENYHGVVIRCPHGKSGESLDLCDCHWHPLKGTPMLGATTGYYEPEWSEKTAWEWLQDLVEWGDRAATMTDAEWAETLKVARTKPITRKEIDAMLADEPELEEAA
jgi:hypothetical protein